MSCVVQFERTLVYLTLIYMLGILKLTVWPSEPMLVRGTISIVKVVWHSFKYECHMKRTHTDTFTSLDILAVLDSIPLLCSFYSYKELAQELFCT